MPDTLKKLFRRIQEGMEGIADAVLGDRAERLLDEEIRTVDDALHSARAEHAAAKARRIANDHRLAESKSRIAETEARVESLLRQRRTGQARTAAADVVRQQDARDELDAQGKELLAQEHRFAHLVEQLEGRLRRLKHQLDILRAANSLQRAQATVARRQPGETGHPEPAFASAARMKRNGRAAGAPAGNGRGRKPARAVADPADAVLARAEKRIKTSARKR